MGVFGFFSYTSTQTTVVEKSSAGQSTTVSTAPVRTLPMDKVASESIPAAEDTSSATSAPHTSSNPGLNTDVAVKISSDARKVSPGDFLCVPSASLVNRLPIRNPPFPLFTNKKGGLRPVKILKNVHRKSKLRNQTSSAQQSALAIRSLIVGPTSAAAPKTTPVTAKPQLNALKTQLMQPKSANKLIMHLRTLPAHDEMPTQSHEPRPKGPIHAVCLEHTDDEEHQLHFAKLVKDELPRDTSSPENFNFQGVTSAPLEQLTSLFSEMHVVDLVSSPILDSGNQETERVFWPERVPTAKTVIDGFTKITPELMALGYATGKAITPDHLGMAICLTTVTVIR